MTLDQIKDLIATVGVPAALAVGLLYILHKDLREIHADLHQLRETIQVWISQTERDK